MTRVITPGGRVGDDAHHDRSPKENWVDKRGGLPRYIRIVRNGLMKDGHDESSATGLAVAAMKRWAHGGDNVSPKVQKAAAEALAEWEAMKGTKSLDSDTVAGSDFKAAFTPTLLADLWEQIELPIIEAKDDAMKMERKAAAVSGLTVDDAEHGIVTTIVSVTGVKDNVRDVIHPGAYAKSLAARTPKGVWSHAWDTPVSKTLAVKELMPGDPLLPKTMPNGDPFPSDAGALLVKTQFNLETQRGREAYSDVVFFGDQQEWSIGYQVPPGGARMDSKSGVRHIDYLELYEYSPVLFGAMSAARTVTDPARAGAGVKVLDHDAEEDAYMEFPSVKAAQTAYKSITMGAEEFKEWASAMETKGLGIDGPGHPHLGVNCDDADCADCKKGKRHAGTKDDDTEDVEAKGAGMVDATDDDEGDGEDDDDLGIFGSLGVGGLGIGIKSYDYETLVKTRDAINFILDIADERAAEQKDFLEDLDEGLSTEMKSLEDIIDANADTLGDAASEMKDAAEAFDYAFKDNDADGMNEYGMEVLTVIEKSLATAEDEATVMALHKVAAGVAAMAPEDEADMQDTETDDEAAQDDMDGKGGKQIPPKPGKKSDDVDLEEKSEPRMVTIETKELDDLRVGFHNLMQK